MKSNKRVPTHQTNSSKKKKVKDQQQGTSFQLPKINKSSNYDTNSNVSYDCDMEFQKEGNYNLDEIEENPKQQIGIVNYEKMTMEEIKFQYQRLREEVSALSSQIKKKELLFQSKITKKHVRASNSQDKQKQIAQVEKEIYDNSYVLGRLRVQNEQMDKRSNLANSSISKPNAEFNEKVLELKTKILNSKEKIKLLKRKTKKTGDDIVDSQNIHEVLQKLQRQEKAYLSKRSNLESKIQESNFKLQRQEKNLPDIQNAFRDAQDYLKLFKLQNQEQVEKNNLLTELKQRQQKHVILNKKIQSDQQLFLQRYHQTLKVFQLQNEKLQKMDKRLIDADVKILQAQNIILDHEQEENQLEDILTRLNQQQNLQKETTQLKRMMHQEGIGQESTFLTRYAFTNASVNSNNHTHGVRSIIEENESDARQTLQISDELQKIQNDKLLKQQNRLLFTKVQETNARQNQNVNFKSLTTKNMNEKEPHSRDGKYYLSSKQINKKRQQTRNQQNQTSIRKNGSTNQANIKRKANSVLHPKNPSKLKQISINSGTQIIIEKNSKRKDQFCQITPHTAKQPYINFNKNNYERQIQKGKSALRDRKRSLIAKSTMDKQQKLQIRNNLIQELEKINKELHAPQKGSILSQNENRWDNDQTKLQAQSSTLHQRMKTLEDENRSNFIGKIVKPSSKEGGLRHQQHLKKQQIMNSIDNNNKEYSRKIQQLKKQFENRGDSQLTNIAQQVQISQMKEETIHKDQVADHSVGQAQSLLIKVKQNILEKNERINQNAQVIQTSMSVLVQQIPSHLDRNVQNSEASESESQQEDDDIQNDIQEINEMVKVRRQSNEKVQPLA